jgi:hypothetical protein
VSGHDHRTGFDEFIEVVSCGFTPMGADRLGAGTTFEVKCLFAIDSITAVYRANRESGRKAHSARVSGRYELIFSQLNRLFFTALKVSVGVLSFRLHLF